MNEEKTPTLAYIVSIKKLAPIVGADRIVLATFNEVLYQAVVKRGEHSVGDLVVYIERDSVVPKTPWSEFLADPTKPDKPIRIKSIRLRGVLSQGLVLPIAVLPDGATPAIGVDVTSALGVLKYVEHASHAGENFGITGSPRGNFPSEIIPKTDEDNIKGNMSVFDELKTENIPVYITLKMDGQSFTAIRPLDGSPLRICSRNLELKTDDDAVGRFLEIAKQYDLFKRLPPGFAIQGEICGPGVQGNRIGLDSPALYGFTVKDLKTETLLGYPQISKFFMEIGVPMVPLVYAGPLDKFMDIGAMIEFASSLTYSTGRIAEGMVVRPLIPVWSPRLRKFLSFKVMNDNYLVKYAL